MSSTEWVFDLVFYPMEESFMKACATGPFYFPSKKMTVGHTLVLCSHSGPAEVQMCLISGEIFAIPKVALFLSSSLLSSKLTKRIEVKKSCFFPVPFLGTGGYYLREEINRAIPRAIRQIVSLLVKKRLGTIKV